MVLQKQSVLGRYILFRKRILFHHQVLCHIIHPQDNMVLFISMDTERVHRRSVMRVRHIPAVTGFYHILHSENNETLVLPVS